MNWVFYLQLFFKKKLTHTQTTDKAKFEGFNMKMISSLRVILFYKITKIVGALWLAERRVYMRVSVLITQARIWKSFLVENLTSLLYLSIPSSAETRKIFTSLLCQFVFASADILSEKNPYFGKNLFLQNKNWLRLPRVYETSRMLRISALLISAQKESFAFLPGKVNL